MVDGNWPRCPAERLQLLEQVQIETTMGLIERRVDVLWCSDDPAETIHPMQHNLPSPCATTCSTAVYCLQRRRPSPTNVMLLLRLPLLPQPQVWLMLPMLC